jgi:hypothetical protein
LDVEGLWITHEWGKYFLELAVSYEQTAISKQPSVFSLLPTVMSLLVMLTKEASVD